MTLDYLIEVYRLNRRLLRVAALVVLALVFIVYEDGWVVQISCGTCSTTVLVNRYTGTVAWTRSNCIDSTESSREGQAAKKGGAQ